MKKKRTWSSMAKRTACILTALCVTAAAVPGTGGYNYSEVFAAEEADDLREGLSVYLNFEDALTTNSAVCPESGSAGQRSYQKRERRYFGKCGIF